jgi:23S rRNA (cytidine1920-2'-O)/16S rRNA (cytidine1409-2'-O)-methyltransferase
MIKPDAEIRILGNTLPYVSRGGLKLEKALKTFPITLEGKVMADIGASTGGFTDCSLQNGASKVYAIDVGYGQLAWKLRQDARVINMERTNVRYVTKEDVGELIDFASIDVAFISLTKVLGPVKELLKPAGELVALIKPQFEAGRENVGKKGVVKDPKIHEKVIEEVISFAKEIGFVICGLTYSPVKGPEGNIEYLMWASNDSESEEGDIQIKDVVSEAHKTLDH